MPVTINGRDYYRTAEVCRILGTSRNTLFRWLARRVVRNEYRDYRGWRLFTQDEIDKLNTGINRITSVDRKYSADAGNVPKST